MSAMMSAKSLVEIKDGPPYIGDLEPPISFNFMTLATLDPKTGSSSFPKKLNDMAEFDLANIHVF
jgi:hypothetical protein